MKMKCVITDDEPMARKGLRSYIEKIDFLTLIGECEDALQLNALLKTEKPDLIFLDIEMPHISGIDLLANIPNPPKVIIVSAYEQYALKGYELDVADYLLKPVNFDRFLKAVNKVYARFEQERKELPADAEEHIFVKSDKQLKKIILKDILFVESMENYVIIHNLSGKEVTYTTLKQIMEVLPASNFLQVHRSYVVNINRVQAIEGNMLDVCGHKIPVARNLRKEVFGVILKEKLISRSNKDSI